MSDRSLNLNHWCSCMQNCKIFQQKKSAQIVAGICCSWRTVWDFASLWAAAAAFWELNCRKALLQSGLWVRLEMFRNFWSLWEKYGESLDWYLSPLPLCVASRNGYHTTYTIYTIPCHRLIPVSSQINALAFTGPCKGEYCWTWMVVVPIFLIFICCSCCCLMMFCHPEDRSANRIVYQSPDDSALNNRTPTQPNTKIEDFFGP